MEIVEEEQGLTLRLAQREEGPGSDLMGEFRDAALHSRSLRVDATKVERIGTLSLQTLVAVSQAIDDAGGTFILASPSDVFVQTCADLGLGPWMTAWREEA